MLKKNAPKWHRPAMLVAITVLSDRSRTTTSFPLASPSIRRASPTFSHSIGTVTSFSGSRTGVDERRDCLSRGRPAGALFASTNIAEYSSLSITELKDLLRKKGSKVSGRKSELIERLSLLDEEEENGEENDDEENDEEENDEEDEENGISYDESSDSSQTSYPVSISDIPASTIQPLLSKRNITNLLPVQSQSFHLVYGGDDAVIHAPTGSGKTLAYVLPLLSKLANDHREESTPRVGSAAAPRILVIVPSRELAKQVGREWHSLHPLKTKGVVTVFGGTPLERNVAALKGGRGQRQIDIVVGTAGRLRELVRENHLSFDNVQSLVLDEADSLLNFKDNPDVEEFLDGMVNDYQLILVSATINKFVRDFAMDIMEIDETSDSFVMVKGNVAIGDSSNGQVAKEATSITNEQHIHGAPPVRHWSIATRANVRRAVVSDLITTLHPRITIIFVPTKAEVELVGAELSEESGGAHEVRVLHGDMVQSARSRTVALLRGNGKERGIRQKVLVATDVASRGLDLDGVDLVIQFGIPRQNGKEKTYDTELYTHRTGRAGRFGGDRDRSADAVVLYDPTRGEGKILPSLKEELKQKLGFDIWDRPLPSSTDVMDATYEKVDQRCNKGDEHLVTFFREKLLKESNNHDEKEQTVMLLDKLSRAMAALSGLEQMAPMRSLLTADPTQQTVRAFKMTHTGDTIISATPPQITKLCKGLGTGKIGRVEIWEDGSAVFDLPEKKAKRLMTGLADSQDRFTEDGEWHIELPSILPPRLQN